MSRLDWLRVPRPRAIHILRVRGGQVTDRWVEVDMLGLLQQLGAVPPLGSASA